MANHVFIPSRGRWDNAKILTKVWYEHGFNIHWVIEDNEHDRYFDAVCIPYSGATRVNGQSTFIHTLPISNAGIGNARNHCVNLAASFGYKSMILADDDIKPYKNVDRANMAGLLKCAEHAKVLGITARYSYHSLCLGDDIADRDDLILLPTGTFRLVALNIKNVLSIGNYDKKLEYAEDCDLFLRGLKAGYPWMLHLGTWTNSIGNRYAPGGMTDFVKMLYPVGEKPEDMLQDSKREWHETLYNKYPEIINDPEKADFTRQNSIRVQWRRAYDLYLPGWRKWSMLHGGYLAYYTGDAKVDA